MSRENLLVAAFLKKFPIDGAHLLETMDTQEAANLLSALPSDILGCVLQYVIPATSVAILGALPDEKILEVLPYMSPPAAISILRQGERSWQAGILGKLDTKSCANILKGFSFSTLTAGRLADSRVLLFTQDRTVSDAIQWLCHQPRYEVEDLFILDRNHFLVGKVTMRSLLINDLDSVIEKIMKTDLETIPAEWTLDDVLTHPYWQVEHTMPVIDTAQTFLGVIRYPALLTLVRNRPTNQMAQGPDAMPTGEKDKRNKDDTTSSDS